MKMLRLPLKATLAVALSLSLGLPVPAVAAEQLAPEVAVVTALYRAYAWEAVVEEPAGAGRSLIEQPQSELARYFDGPLAALIAADRQCALKTQAICKLDFQPLWDSQDAGGTVVSIRPGSKGGEVQVALRAPGAKQERRLTFVIAGSGAQARIADIRFPGKRPSLKTLLAAPAGK